jgi:signal transduction histidine kinase
LRVELQLKAMLFLAVAVLGAVGGGVWFYLSATRPLSERLLVVAAAVAACAVPLGGLVVWRVVLQPLGRLAATERQMAELTEANHRLTAEMADKEEFLRAVSHDLGAPLRNIAGMATMLLLKCGQELPGEVRHRLERIRANADAQAAMISDVLELSRIRSGSPRCQVVDLADVLAEQERHFEFELQSRHIGLEVAGTMPHLCVEKHRFAQVFQNLIDNAIKYMDKPAGGRIVVGHRIVGPYHEFRVTDNGPGIPADQQREIFCLFRRARTAQTDKVPGKGVGLAVVSAIVSTYGGRAWVESQEGQGASFCFTLSLERTAPPADADSTPDRRAAPASGAFRTPEKGRQIPCAEKAGPQDRTSD